MILWSVDVTPGFSATLPVRAKVAALKSLQAALVTPIVGRVVELLNHKKKPASVEKGFCLVLGVV
ncbi:hypothetical protein [Mesorhizobium sp.]|uniref:hypothetical protein n=1 Tax=Mesorhizobium sp. TaxID=1871066 RepID=UPI000FE84F31|nr:hypothetical protein [Mesorhizobium sp.]RWP55872.1 MAG: hypothetical protein EOR07_33010 [Mesorhizobium sp.]